MADTPPQRITIWCPTCNNARYKSNKAYTKDDRPHPSDFIALVDTQDPPMEGKPILCSDCGSMCKPVLEHVAEKLEQATEPATNVIPIDRAKNAAYDRASVLDSAPTREPVRVQSVVELFRADPDEQILNLSQREEKILVVTNRRIILV